jgi:hypothetical protein
MFILEKITSIINLFLYFKIIILKYKINIIKMEICNSVINTCQYNKIVWEQPRIGFTIENYPGIYFKIDIKPTFNFNTIYGKIVFSSQQNQGKPRIDLSNTNNKRIFFYPNSYVTPSEIKKNLIQGIRCFVTNPSGDLKTYYFYYRNNLNFLNSNLKNNNYIYINLTDPVDNNLFIDIDRKISATGNIFLSSSPTAIPSNIKGNGIFSYGTTYNPLYDNNRFKSIIPSVQMRKLSTNFVWNQSFSGFDRPCKVLQFDNSNKLYAGGDFINAGEIHVKYIARWDGISWSGLSTGLNASCWALETDSAGNVYAGGSFTQAGGKTVNYIAKWDIITSTWSALGTGLNGPCRVLKFDKNKINLYVGGVFSEAGIISANKISRWNIQTSTWSSLGSGLSSATFSIVYDLEVHPVSGDIYAIGLFSKAGSISVNNIAKWDIRTSTWSALGSGLNAKVYCLTFDSIFYNLYVGGYFDKVGEIYANNIAKWDGTSWSALGTGLGTGLGNGLENCLVLKSDSFGNIYAGGYFKQAGGISANKIAKWDGKNWHVFSSGLNDAGYCNALALNSIGNLYIGGNFTQAGGITGFKNIAKLTTILPIAFNNSNKKQIIQGSIDNPPRYINFSCNLSMSFGTPYYFSILLSLKKKDKTIRTLNIGNINNKILLTKHYSGNLFSYGQYKTTGGSVSNNITPIILNNFYENYILYLNIPSNKILKTDFKLYNDINLETPFYTFTYGDPENVINNSLITIKTNGDMSNIRKISVTFISKDVLNISNIKCYGYNGNNLPDFDAILSSINLEQNTVNKIDDIDNYSLELNCYSDKSDAVAIFNNIKFESYDIPTYLDNVQKITIENINNKPFDITGIKFYDTTYNQIIPTNNFVASGDSFYTLYFPNTTKLQKIVYNNTNKNDLTDVQIKIFTFNDLYYELIGKTLPITQIQSLYTWIYPYFNLRSATDGCGVFTNNFTLAYKKNTSNLLYSYGGMIYNPVEKISDVLTQIKGVCWSNVYNLFYCYGIRNGNNSGVIYSKDGIIWNQQTEFTGMNCIGMSINYYNDIIVAITDNSKLFYNNNGDVFKENKKISNINYRDITWGTKGFFISGISDDKTKNIIYSFNGINWYNNNDIVNTNTYFINIYSGYNTNNRNIIVAIGADKKVYYSNNYYNWKTNFAMNNNETFIKIVTGKKSFLLLTNSGLYSSTDGIKWSVNNFKNITLLYYYNSTFYLYGQYSISIEGNIADNNLPLTLYTSSDGITWQYIENYTPLPDVDNFYDLTVYVPRDPVNIADKIDYININTAQDHTLDPDIMKNLIIYNEFDEIIMPGDFDLFQIFCESTRIYKIEINLEMNKNYKNMFLTIYRYIYDEKNTTIIDSEIIGRTVPLPDIINYTNKFRYSWVYPNYLLNYSTDGQIGYSFTTLICGTNGIYSDYFGDGAYWNNCSPNTTTDFTSICNGTVKYVIQQNTILQNTYVATCEPDSQDPTYKNVNLAYSYDTFNWKPAVIMDRSNKIFNPVLKLNKVICGYPVINNIITTVFIAIGETTYNSIKENGSYFSYDGINWKYLVISPSVKFDDICWSGNYFYLLSNNSNNSTKIYKSFSAIQFPSIYYDMNNDKQNNSSLKNFSKIYAFAGSIYLIESNSNKLFKILENSKNPKLLTYITAITTPNIDDQIAPLNSVTKPIKLNKDISTCYNLLYTDILGIKLFAATIPVVNGTKNNFIYTLNNGNTWNYSAIPVPSSIIPTNLIYNNNYIISFYSGLIAYSSDFQNWNIVKIPTGCLKINAINLINDNVENNPVNPVNDTPLTKYNYINTLNIIQDSYQNNGIYQLKNVQNGKYIKLIVEDVDINSDKPVLTKLSLDSLCNDPDTINSNIPISTASGMCKNLCMQFKPINKTNQMINNIYTINKDYDGTKLNDYFIINKANLDISTTYAYDKITKEWDSDPYYNILNMPNCNLDNNNNMMYTQKFLYNYDNIDKNLDYENIYITDKLKYD